MKVVITNSTLSMADNEVIKRYAKLKNLPANFDISQIDRTDSTLIQVVEELNASDFKIIEIPDNVKWTIREQDNSEYLVENHQIYKYKNKTLVAEISIYFNGSIATTYVYKFNEPAHLILENGTIYESDSSFPLACNITDVFIYAGDRRNCSISGNCACIINNVTDIELSHGIAYVYVIKEFEICS